MSFTNAQLATKISDLIAYWSVFNEEYSNWLGGTVTGGPGANGLYPLTDYEGNEDLVACPAKLADNVAGYVGLASASETAAAASAAAASSSETAAAASAVTATAQAVLADADRVAAELAESGAVDAKVTAIAQAAAAVVSAAAALASEVAAAASEAAAAISETNAAASAAAAATFDPVLYAALADDETITGKYTFTDDVHIGGTPDGRLYISDDNSAADEKNWLVQATGATLRFYSASDDKLSFDEYMKVTRNAASVTINNVTIHDLLNVGNGLGVTGNITVTGTVDGRDIAADGANLDTAYGWGDHSAQNYFDLDGNVSFANELTISHDSSVSLIFYSAAGPFGIRWDNESGVTTEHVDLVYRTGPKTLQFERVSDGADMLVLDPSDLSFQLSAGTIGGATINSTLIGQWDTAYGWGNHAGLYEDLRTDFRRFEQAVAIPAGGAITEIKEFDGTSYGATDAHELLVRAYIPGTGTDIALVGRFYSDSGAWSFEEFYVSGVSSNHLKLGLVGGLPGIGHYHASAYTASVEVQQFNNRTKFGDYEASKLSDIALGVTANGWGDHASGGYAPLANPAFTGNVSAPDFRSDGYATQTTPTYSTDVDTDSGFYNESSNVVAISTAGVRRLQLYATYAIFTPTIRSSSAYTAPVAGAASLMNAFLHLDGKEAIDGDDTWLRLNQNGDFTAGVYTPYDFRYDGILTANGNIVGDGTVVMTGIVSIATSGDSNSLGKYGMSYGIHGNYSGEGTTWGANIWAISASYDGAIETANSSSSTHYGLRWLRSTHVSANAAIGEGLYVYQNGSLEGGIGTNGIYSVAGLRVDGDCDFNGNIVGDGATTITGIEQIVVDSTADIRKTSHGCYLYHQSTAYDNDQNGGITFSTSAPSGGTTGDIWFEYT
jgi:hypothetical protein